MAEALQMTFLRTAQLIRFSAFITLLLIAGCSTTPTQDDSAQAVPKPNQRYCTTYFIYEMCAYDVNADGHADALYFNDTKEVFMYDVAQQLPLYDELPFHPCVHIMDEDLREASTRLLYIYEDTSFAKKTKVKAQLINQYLRYSGSVSACEKEYKKSLPKDTEHFDDFADDDSEF